ncbi:uncharacterized protein BDW43DRAFT_312289 [Aspergillus alliaceus]|uniref:uncharacterized protein n=1 Tax=Petromyces alliaceus TaxID=209559 RepID=UPI0012A5AC02|nr:uncharacterized protein BDW43DRAFT_312289 [Aspergillus alliaceus]KAB8232293.1 hypothetical protein BDW43DRAFT_312289 [Aspergillus alliaceus]
MRRAQMLRWQLNAEQMFLSRHSCYSPALDEMKIEYHPVQFNGSLDFASSYRGPPSPEVDAAWDELAGLGLMSVTRDQITLLRCCATTLMCNADVGTILHEWVERSPRPYPNFNTWHQCRNFEDIKGWIKGNTLRRSYQMLTSG